jgi:hypothetical protein
MSSPEPDGGTGPMLSKTSLTVEHYGEKELTVPAGTYKADHWAFLLRRPHTGNEELWTLGDDLIPLKIAYPIYNSTYELAELEIG